jgi:hypothetical protein
MPKRRVIGFYTDERRRIRPVASKNFRYRLQSPQPKKTPTIRKMTIKDFPVYVHPNVPQSTVAWTEETLGLVPKKYIDSGKFGMRKIVLLPQPSDKRNVGAYYAMTQTQSRKELSKVGVRPSGRTLIIYYYPGITKQEFQSAVLHEYGHFVWFTKLSPAQIRDWRKVYHSAYYEIDEEDFAEAFSRHLLREPNPESYRRFFSERLKI